MKIYADARGNISALYRSAVESVHRDIYLLDSNDSGKSFEGTLLQKWDINACPMSSMDIAAGGKALIGAWEIGGQIYWAWLVSGSARAAGPPRFREKAGTASTRESPSTGTAKS